MNEDQATKMIATMASCDASVRGLTNKVDQLTQEVRQERHEQHVFNKSIEDRIRLQEQKCVAPDRCVDHESRLRTVEVIPAAVDALSSRTSNLEAHSKDESGFKKQLALILITSLFTAAAGILVPRMFTNNISPASKVEEKAE